MFRDKAGEDIEMVGATDEDQDFIASCRQDIPLLISEIERLRKILDENENKDSVSADSSRKRSK